jgi:hypothetical protein
LLKSAFLKSTHQTNLGCVLDLHATPHNPNPELSTTDPLLTSATASLALSHNFDPPRSVLGVAVDLQCLECEKYLLSLKLWLKLLPGTALTLKPLMTMPPPTVATAKCREHTCRANMVTGAIRLAVRTTPTIISFLP